MRHDRHRDGTGEARTRDRVLAGLVAFGALVIVIRLAHLQVVHARFYRSLAAGQREIYAKLLPERGEILVREKGADRLYPVAANRDLWTVYADTRAVTDPAAAADALAPLLYVPPTEDADEEALPGKTEKEKEAERALGLATLEASLEEKLSVKGDPYQPLLRGADASLVDAVRALAIRGINFAPERARFYTDPDFGGHVLGFVGWSGDEKAGRYGVEGYWEEELAGVQGYISSERDPAGRLIAIADRTFSEKQDGADLVLTIDRTLQAASCSRLRDWVKLHGASGGSVVMVDVSTGAVMVMCGVPDFDPNVYQEVERASDFNNPAIFNAYEPGSVMKTITIAGALDAGAITPTTSYEDPGEERFGEQVIRNADGKAHGTQTMVQVLDESLNTGAIFVMRQMGAQKLREYLRGFGFGTRTGIELETESAGNVAILDKKAEVYAATASFGQGLTTTPLQLAAAYASIANGGKLMRPYVIDEIRHADGTAVKTPPQTVRQVISGRAATLAAGMLISVVKNGHGRRAGVPGYLVAGKTGTAQIPRTDGPGYEDGPTIGTFAGFAPASNPRFAMVVRVDRPADTLFAESSAAPLFGEIAQFTLRYLGIPPDGN